MGATKLAYSFDRFANHLVQSDGYLVDNDGSTSEVLKAFEDLCYTATELFDVYAQGIPNTINLRPSKQFKESEAQYRETLKSRRSDWALICNLIEHNHSVLLSARQFSQRTGKTVRGFCLCRPTGEDGIGVNRELHGKAETSCQFEIAAHQLIHDIVRCDLAAATLFDQLPDTSNAKAQSNADVSFLTGKSLAIVAGRNVAAGDHRPIMFDGFDLTADRIVFGRKHTPRVPE